MMKSAATLLGGATHLFNVGFDEKLIKKCLNIAFLALRKLSDVIELLCTD